MASAEFWDVTSLAMLADALLIPISVLLLPLAGPIPGPAADIIMLPLCTFPVTPTDGAELTALVTTAVAPEVTVPTTEPSVEPLSALLQCEDTILNDSFFTLFEDVVDTGDTVEDDAAVLIHPSSRYYPLLLSAGCEVIPGDVAAGGCDGVYQGSRTARGDSLSGTVLVPLFTAVVTGGVVLVGDFFEIDAVMVAGALRVSSSISSSASPEE
uniref:Uncharacterized protein n=1 Tax=Anopheles culicifacies TaxID=139723 RepID=A0A182MKL9_9DIPT